MNFLDFLFQRPQPAMPAPQAADSPLAALLASTPPTIPPWIDLRAQRPPPTPMLDLSGLFSGPSGITPPPAGVPAFNAAAAAGEAPTTPLAALMQSFGQMQLPQGGPDPGPQPSGLAQIAPKGSALEHLAGLIGQGAEGVKTGIGNYGSNIKVGAEATAAPQAPAAAAPKIKWGLPEATPAAAKGPTTFTVGPQGPAPAAPSDPKIAAMSLIRQREGLITTPKWDVNALRVGYGSDTITDAEGNVKPVGKDTKITQEDAERDLERRASESMGTVKTAVGDEAFNKLNANQVAALTSVTYNYGKLPAGVAKAVKTGDSEKIAQSIEALASDNEGVNKERRAHEASIARGVGQIGGPPGMPGVAGLRPPQLPIPTPTQPLAGMDPAAFDKFNALTVSRAKPLETGDRLTTILGAMAAGAQGTRNIGDFLLGAGAGAGKGAAANIASMRNEEKDYLEREDQLKKFLAQIGLQKEEAAMQAKNFVTAAKNEDNRLLTQVKTEQAKLDAATQNRVAELMNDRDWKVWDYFQPVVKADKEGITVVEKNAQGGIKVTSHKGNEMDALADRIRDAGAVFGKDSETVEAMQYQALAKQGEQWVRRQIMRDMVEKNMTLDVLGPDQDKELTKAAEKRVDPKLLGKPEEYSAQVKQAKLDLLWQQLQGKDDVWLPKMLQKGNFGARLLAQPQT